VKEENAVFAIITAIAMLAVTTTRPQPVQWTPTTDPSVAWHWTLDPDWRPICNVQIRDTAAQEKFVTISYRNKSNSRVDLTLRMNPGDPQERVIGGCKMIDHVTVHRPSAYNH
jgi:hypothetical protein